MQRCVGPQPVTSCGPVASRSPVRRRGTLWHLCRDLQTSDAPIAGVALSTHDAGLPVQEQPGTAAEPAGAGPESPAGRRAGRNRPARPGNPPRVRTGTELAEQYDKVRTTYKAAGACLYAILDDTVYLLMVRHEGGTRRACSWTFLGGKREARDNGPEGTAAREVCEESHGAIPAQALSAALHKRANVLYFEGGAYVMFFVLLHNAWHLAPLYELVNGVIVEAKPPPGVRPAAATPCPAAPATTLTRQLHAGNTTISAHSSATAAAPPTPAAPTCDPPAPPATPPATSVPPQAVGSVDPPPTAPVPPALAEGERATPADDPSAEGTQPPPGLTPAERRQWLQDRDLRLGWVPLPALVDARPGQVHRFTVILLRSAQARLVRMLEARLAARRQASQQATAPGQQQERGQEQGQRKG